VQAIGEVSAGHEGDGTKVPGKQLSALSYQLEALGEASSDVPGARIPYGEDFCRSVFLRFELMADS
jgi:hypothetical protein